MTRPERPRPAAQTLLAVAKGEPTPEELAALTAVVLSLGSGAAAAPDEAQRPALGPPAAAAAGAEARSRRVEAQPRLSTPGEKFSNPFITAAARLVSFG